MDIDNAELNSSTATTQPSGDNSTKVATTAYADAAAPSAQSFTVTRDSNNLVSVITRSDTTTKTITRDSNEFIATIVDTLTGQTKTVIRDSDNLISNVVVT